MVKRWKLHSQQLFLMDWFSYVIISWFVGCENSLTTKWNKSQHTPSVTKSVRNGWLVIYSLKSCKIEFRTNQRKKIPQVFCRSPDRRVTWKYLIKQNFDQEIIYNSLYLWRSSSKAYWSEDAGYAPKTRRLVGAAYSEDVRYDLEGGPYREGPGITQRPDPPPGVCQDIDHPSHPYLSNKKRIFFVPDDMFAPSIDV